MKKYLLIALVGLASCNQKKSNVLVVGFVDAFQDNTIEQAKIGFIDALKKNGFDEQKGNVKITYRNTQGNIPYPHADRQLFYFRKGNIDSYQCIFGNHHRHSKNQDHPHFYDAGSNACFNEGAE